MAHWNPYFNTPNQSNPVYNGQNSESQTFFNQTFPYNPTPFQQFIYNEYYFQNSAMSNFNSESNMSVPRQQFGGQYLPNTASQQMNFSNNLGGRVNLHRSNERDVNQSNTAVKFSNLTPTAAEFKPSTSSSGQESITIQTFYRNNDNKSLKGDVQLSKGAIPKNDREGKSEMPIKSSEPEEQRKITKSNNIKYQNHKYYNNNSGQSYNNDKYKFYDRYEYNRSKRNMKRDEVQNTGANGVRNSSDNSHRETHGFYNFSNGRYNKNDNRESNKMNYRDNNERGNFERNSHPRDNYKSSNYGRPTYRSSYKDENRSNYRDDNRVNYRDENRSSYKDRNANKEENSTNNKDESKCKNWRSIPRELQPVKSNFYRNNKEEPNNLKSNQYKEKVIRKEIIKTVEKSADDDISQRDRLIDQVTRGTLECLVCCERVRPTDKVWSCKKCFHILHLKCLTKWANTCKDENGWRCPACQHVCLEIPTTYYCYCGKTKDPQYLPGDTPHSCGNMCGKIGFRPGCGHPCSLLCHPGPCPKCEAMVSRSCNCGATKQIIQCCIERTLICDAVCGKLLECGVHTCTKTCHRNECIICTESIKQDCFCGKSERTVPCSKDQTGIKDYSCENVCGKLLSCGHHNCKEICHQGNCPPCVRAPDQVKTCPCGKTELEKARESCLDPIDCCEKICGKDYLCGQPCNPHTCKDVCHEGDCPVCLLSSFVRCRCGHMSCEIPCKELMSRADDARCEKRCTKKRTCGKHKCNQLCCIDINHICTLPCNRMLSCGQHRCDLNCHKGRCQPCWRTSFDELYCECGANVTYPPIPCGTKRPACARPCSRRHNCDHEVLHNCHSLSVCTPCTVLTTKWCHGGHEKRGTIPCHQQDFSCGLPCGKDLSCGRHKCQQPCHLGPCLKEGQNCSQPCVVIRETCGHLCGLSCHDPPCVESPCKEMVRVTCECGLRSSSRMCVDMTGEYQRIATSLLASKMADMQLGHSVDIGDITGITRNQILKTLECTDECRLVERNRRLAIGLQIRNPDLSAKLTPRYSESMKQWAKKDSCFVQMVHDKLSELVKLAKESKQKSRSYSFESMNRDKRQFIHEYCEHFGCESAAYDKEPNRNVVATAARDKAWLPSVSVLELLQRESGQRKVPGPMLNRPLGASKNSGSETISLKLSTTKSTKVTGTSFSSTLRHPKTPEGEKMDYFDYMPTKNK